MKTLTAYPFDTYPLGDGSDASLNQFKLPLTFSPDQQSVVRLGSSDGRDRGTDEFRGTVAKLLVFNFVDRTSLSKPMPTAPMGRSRVRPVVEPWARQSRVWFRFLGRRFWLSWA